MYQNVLNRQTVLINSHLFSYAPKATFKFLASENTCTDGFGQEDDENEDESCLEQSHEVNAISSSTASAKDVDQTEEETMSLDTEGSTKSQDTLLGKLCPLIIFEGGWTWHDSLS